MAYNPYDLRGSAAAKQAQSRKKDWEEQKPEILKQAQQIQQEAKRKRVLELLSQNMNTGAPSIQDQREMRLTEAVRLEDQAKRQYEDYARSEAGRAEAQEAQRLQNQLAFSSGGSITFPMGALAQGEKTLELKAKADYFEQNRKDTHNRNLMEKDLEEVARMSAEDRKLLETYAYGRNEWFDHQKIADSISARAELEKKYGKQKMGELAESWQWYQNALNAERTRKEAQEAGDGFGAKVAHSAASVIANAVNTMSAPLGYLQEALHRTGRYQTLDPNNAGNMAGVYASAAREAVSEDMGTAGKVLYQGGMIALDNAARIGMGGGTKFGSLGLAALGSFGSTLSEASAQGATPGQAVGKAVLSSGIEVATEYVPLDELFKAGKGGYKGAKAAFKQALKQGGIEAAEEEIALLGNVLVDALVMREKSSYNQQIGELVANGMSYADAKAQADRALWDEAVNTAVTSWVSGGVMSGAQSGAQYVGQRIQERNAAKDATAAKTEAVGAENAPTEKPTADEYIDAMVKDLDYRDAALEQSRAQAPADDGSQEAINRVIGVPAQNNTAQQSANESAGIKRQIQASQETLAGMDPVAQIDTPREFAGMDLMQKINWVVEKLRPTNYQVDRKGFGVIKFGKKQLRSAFNYFKSGTVEESAFEAIPYVLEHGTEISARTDHKDRGYGTVTFAAPVTINGKRGNMAVVVKQTSDNFYKVHRILSPDGTVFNLQDTEKTGPTMTGESPDTGSLATPKGPVSNNSITDDAGNVNGQNGPQGEETGGFGDNAGKALYKSLGAAGQKFKHEVRRSKVYDNTYKNATDPEVRTAGEKALGLDPKIAEYDYISEEESVSNARDRVNAPDGLEAELEYLTGKQGWTGEDNDTAMMILKQLQKDGDVSAFKALARAQREQGTSGGQFIQSFAKYSRDATRAAVDAVEMLDKLGKGDVPKKFWKKNGSFDAWKDDILKSTMEIANDIEGVADGDAEAMRNIVRQLANFRKTTAFFGMSSNLTKNAERILRKMDFNTAKDIACAQLAKIPDDFRSRSKGEVIKAIRYQNMLSSLVTVGRNLVGNGTMGMVDAFSDATAGRFADLLLSKATGKRTVGNDIRYAKEYLNAARNAADMASLLAELDIPAEHEGKYTGRTRTFSPQGGMLSRFFSAYEKYMNYALQVSDEFFSGGTAGAVSKSLEALGAKSGLTDEEIAALGDRVGRRRTFKEGRRLARASGKMKDALNVLGTEDFGAGDVVLAFAETPAEMGQVAIDYSGTGILEGFAEMASIIKDARNGKAIDAERQRKAVSDFGRGVTGVGMIALFTALAAKGLIAVHDDEDKDKRGLEQSLGLSGAQFNIDATIRALRNESAEWQDGDLVMSIDFLQPFNSQMYIGYLLSQDEEVGLKEYAGATVQGIAQSVLDIPMMGTIEDIADLLTSFGEVSEGDYSAVTDAAGQLIGNQASSFVPAWMRQTAQYMDPVYRDTTGENPLDAAKNRLMSSIPGLSQTLPAKYDGLGNLQTRYDNKLLGFFNTFLNPGALKRIRTSDIADKLEQLGDKSVYPEYLAPKSFHVDGETVMVSGKEMTETYQKTYGDNVAALYGGLMDNEDFQKLSKEQQTEALKLAKSYATQFAKAAVSDYGDIPEGTSSELVQDIIRKQAAAGMEDALKEVSQGWEDGKSASTEAVTGFTNAVLAYDKLSSATKAAVAESAGGALKRYIEAKEKGVGAADFLSLYEASVKTGSYRNFDLVTEGKMNTSAANAIVWMLDGVTGTGKENTKTGERSVRDIDRIQAISDGKGITDKETETAIRLLILDDKQEEKLDNVLNLGYDIDEYADFYQAKVDNSKKADFIAALREMGLSSEAANVLYNAFR